jgi:hypothetical protein
MEEKKKKKLISYAINGNFYLSIYNLDRMASRASPSLGHVSPGK